MFLNGWIYQTKKKITKGDREMLMTDLGHLHDNELVTLLIWMFYDGCLMTLQIRLTTSHEITIQFAHLSCPSVLSLFLYVVLH